MKLLFNKSGLLSFLFMTYLFCVTTLFAQAPQSFTYQAVIRNADGKLMTGQEVGILISILHLEINGRTIYSEYHQVVTAENGLVSFEIGGGRPE